MFFRNQSRQLLSNLDEKQIQIQQEKKRSNKPFSNLASFISIRESCKENETANLDLCSMFNVEEFFHSIDKLIEKYIGSRSSIAKFVSEKTMLEYIEKNFSGIVQQRIISQEEFSLALKEISEHYQYRYQPILLHSIGFHSYRKILALAVIIVKLNQLRVQFKDQSLLVEYKNYIPSRGAGLIKKYLALQKVDEFTQWLSIFKSSVYVSPPYSLQNSMLKMIDSIIDLAHRPFIQSRFISISDDVSTSEDLTTWFNRLDSLINEHAVDSAENDNAVGLMELIRRLDFNKKEQITYLLVDEYQELLEKCDLRILPCDGMYKKYRKALFKLDLLENIEGILLYKQNLKNKSFWRAYVEYLKYYCGSPGVRYSFCNVKFICHQIEKLLKKQDILAFYAKLIPIIKSNDISKIGLLEKFDTIRTGINIVRNEIESETKIGVNLTKLVIGYLEPTVEVSVEHPSPRMRV